MIKTYLELTEDEKRKTFENYQKLCEEDDSYVPFADFEDYDDEQRFLDLDFDAETLECLG